MLRKLYYAPRMIDCSFCQYRTKDAPFQEHSQNGKIAIITGGNSGIGFETAKGLAWQGCEVYILCRNPAKASTAVSQINDHCKTHNSIGSCQAISLDLADLESVKRCIDELRELFKMKKIDYFFCNGGIMGHPCAKSPQGYEMHFATNHLGHFALVGGIFDLLLSYHTRLIVVTGDIAVFANDATPDYVYSDDGTDAYCRSKICNQSFVRELYKRYGNELTVYSVHPGVVDTNLFSLPEGTFLHRIELMIRPFMMIDCVKGAQSSLLCALHKEETSAALTTLPNGSYYHNVYGANCDYHPTALDDIWSVKMWDLSIQLCKQHNVVVKF